MLFHDAKRNKLIAYDGRETAPAAARPDRFLDGQGKPLEFYAAVVGGRSVGVPGTVALLAEAHKRHGKLPWAKLFVPAIDLAEYGFPVSARFNIMAMTEERVVQPRARAYLYDFLGNPFAVGRWMKNPAYAATLRKIAAGGAKAFYEGEIARDIVATVTMADNPGDMTLADLASYRVKVREPVCGNYRAYRVCGMPLPSSGGPTVLQILGILEPFDVKAMGPAALVERSFHQRGRATRVRRSRRLHGRPRFLRRANGTSRSRLPDRALAIDSHRREPRPRAARDAARSFFAPEGRAGRRRGARISVDIAHLASSTPTATPSR